MNIYALDHVQLAMPPDRESDARAFYVGVLELTEISKPPALAARGGLWFESGSLKLHLGVDPEFRPAIKAHPGLLVNNLEALCQRCLSAGCRVVPDHELKGYRRAYVFDPFGNRLELMEMLNLTEAPAHPGAA